MKNELCSDESRRLNGRMKAAVILRQLAVSIIIKIGHTEAVAILGDMLAFLKTKPALLGDLFNLKERMLLEKCIGMLGAVYSAISRVSFTNGSANNQGTVGRPFSYQSYFSSGERHQRYVAYARP